MYYAQRQQVVGSGYAQQVQWVNVPLCKACGERVQVFLSEEDKSLFVQWYNKLSGLGKTIFYFGLFAASLASMFLILYIVEQMFLY